MRWKGYVERMKNRNEHRVWEGKSARLERRWKNNIKIYPKNQNGMACARFICPRAGSKCWTLVNMTSNIRVT